jgi:hypothetical protein
MGEVSMRRASTTDETARIKALLKAAVASVSLGFSTTLMTQHVGYQGLLGRDEIGADSGSG